MTPTYYLNNGQLFEIDRMPPDPMQYLQYFENKPDYFEFDRFDKDLRDFHAYLSTLQPIPHTFTGPSRIVRDIEWRMKCDAVVDCDCKSVCSFHSHSARRVATPKITEGAVAETSKPETISTEGERVKMRGCVVTYSGFTPSNKNHVVIEVMGYENYFGNVIKKDCEVEMVFDPCESLSQHPHSPAGIDEEAAEQTAKGYTKRQGSHDKPEITHHDFKEGFLAGCQHTRREIEDYILREKRLRGHIKVLKEENEKLKSSQPPQEQAGREAVKENIENALESTGQFSSSQCEQLAEIAMACIPASSVSNPVALIAAAKEIDKYLREEEYENGKPVHRNMVGAFSILHKQLRNALFTSQPGE